MPDTQISMQENKEMEKLLSNIQEGLKKYSVKELNQAIVAVLNKKHDKTEEIDYILELVSKEHGISVNTLKKSTSRGKIQTAKQLAYCLLHNNLGLSIRHIAERIFFNWPTSVQTGVKRYRTASSNPQVDKEFMNSYVKLNNKIVGYITTKNEKQ